MPTLLIIFGAVALTAGAVSLHARSNRRSAERHLAGREPLAPEEFGRRFFPKRQAPIAARLRELLADETSVPLQRLHPHDRLVPDLRIDELDSLALAAFVMAIEREYKIELPDADLAHLRTFRELVELVSRKLDGVGTA
jgi:acyl carrier protein